MKLSKRFPDFIKNDKVIQKIKKIDKVFPLLGVCNRSLSLDFVMNKMGERAHDFNKYRNKRYRVCFSSDPWDIATMSMRGIDSCQSWRGWGDYKLHLIGSVIDPCCGIIYLTNGNKMTHGTRMNKRAVVRYVAQKNNHNLNKIVIDRVYPYDRYEIYDLNNQKERGFFHAVFKQTILLMLKNKNINVSKASGGGKWFIPELFDSKSLKRGKLSYRDTKISYQPIDKKNLPKELRKMIKPCRL